jgi:hypothetical protein
MSLRLNRRRWVFLMGSTPLLAQAAAQQTQPSAGTPAPLVEKAQSGMREVSSKLAAIDVPMDIEPAFRFKA